jgi:murein DD-endopeptidase MepM/ murein hydrolase activator NlpD
MTPAPIAVSPVLAQAPVASNYVYQAAGGRVVTVGPGESLETLALKYGAPVAEIAKANQIHSPADLKPGKVIVIPTRVAMAGPAVVTPVAPEAYAPAAAAPPAQVHAAEAGGGVHVVTPGETLYSIGRQYHTRPEQIAAANGLPSNTAVRVGQKLRIPGAGDGPAVAQTVAYTPSEEKPAGIGAPPKPLGKLVVKSDKTIAVPQSMAEEPALPPAPAQPPAPVAAVPPVAPPVPAAAAAPTDTPAVASAAVDAADPPSANGTSFRWPVRGRIISAFGSKPNGERNDGINLAVPEGTSVKAAEAGTVIYAGNELAGYGNLVLIRHADGWVSAYAHNSEILVKRGDKVARGQIIGHAGMTGSVNAPQVHFELRKGAKPVNPLDYLAG